MNKSEFDDAYDDQEHIRGKILATPIKELALRVPIMVDVSATVVAAVNAMNERHTGCVLVQRDGKLAGIFTERDVLTKVMFRPDSGSRRVESVMTEAPETLEATSTVAFALNKMSVGGYRHIPIVDRAGKPVGVLSVRDIVDLLVETFPEGVFNLPPSPDKAIVRSVDGG